MPEVDTFKSNALVVRKGTTSGGKCSSTKGTEPEVDTFKSNAQEEEKIDIFPKEVENRKDSGTEGERPTVDDSPVGTDDENEFNFNDYEAGHVAVLSEDVLKMF